MLSYFEFDVPHLERLINGNAADLAMAPAHGLQVVVEHEDIEMLAIGIINPDYLAARISEKLNTSIESAVAFDALRHYLFRKYQVRSYLGGSVVANTGGGDISASGLIGERPIASAELN
jgi:hypothetical protein